MTHKTVVYKYGTGNPVEPNGSGDVRDGIDNLQSFDVFMNAEEDTYNQRDGEVVQTVAGAIRSVGFKPGTGDFTTGFTVMPGQRNLSWFDQISQEWYSYLGVIPAIGYVVSPGTNPVGDSNWNITSEHFFTQIGAGAVTRQAQDKMRESVSIFDFMTEEEIADVQARTETLDVTAAIHAALNTGRRVHAPKGTYLHTQNGIPSNTVFYGDGVGATIFKVKDGTDQIYHNFVSANATSVDARIATDANVDTVVGPYVTDIAIYDMTLDGNWENRPKTYTDREQGTGLELHKVLRANIERVHVKNAPQHCFNVRAGTGSFEKGYDYVEKYPSQYVRFVDCKALNQLYDDGITTHDSEYIWIERCESWLTRNYENLAMPAVSNGIEIDDGSRYVWVTDCYSHGGFGGFQAKGHDNTPPAHHIWFRNCVAENNHQAFIIAATNSPNTDFNTEAQNVHHIYLDGCTAKNTYPFSNSASFASEGHYIQIYNGRQIFIKDFQVIGKVEDMPNLAAGAIKVIFRHRAVNGYIHYTNLNLRNVDERGIDGQSLFTFESNAQSITFDGVNIDKFIRSSVLFTNAAGVDWSFKKFRLTTGVATSPVIELGGIGGGSLHAEPILGAGFTSGYLLGGTKAEAITKPEYKVRMLTGENVFAPITGCIPAANVGAMVGANIGHDYVYSIDGGASASRVGRTQINTLSGNVNDSTCVTRFGVALRESGSAATVLALNVATTSMVPAVDNKMQGGSSGLRFTQFYAVNSTINTSDEREKSDPREITDQILDVADDIEIVLFQWLDAIRQKGEDGARWHFGPIAQRVRDAFIAHGLDGCDYGLLCYDKWDNEYEDVYADVLDEDGNVIDRVPTGEKTLTLTAGDRWGIRPDQCHWMMLAAARRRAARAESRLDNIEYRLLSAGF